MRLLHTSALTLKEFFGDGIPPYAVLSHRWEEEEVTLQDLTNGGAKELLGYGKLMGCCERAKHDGLDYVWIDTCCIDKTSSAELSEAINSMFEWYQASYICYVYLSDVLEEAEQISEAQSSFRNSKWFTRGWTLQELIAPTWVQFFNAEWRDLGTKSSLRTLIEHITNIRHLSDFRSATIAQKMSWASNRNTTRVEDQAYCLMGLFQIHMPIIYGEGKNAFLRLQLEIIKSSDDESIFAWSYPSKTPLVDKDQYFFIQIGIRFPQASSFPVPLPPLLGKSQVE
ncbi:heterokaryon incompatibility protein-domain-containing protein [Tricladium varicosporioides]|nr:heterokaryon incompatibility protein-domain-containing protein [Hymenoscyphus varicosporioides]